MTWQVDGHVAMFGLRGNGELVIEVQCPKLGTCDREIYDPSEDVWILTDECYVQHCARWFNLDWLTLHDILPLSLPIEMAWCKDGTYEEPVVGLIPVVQMAASNG